MLADVVVVVVVVAAPGSVCVSMDCHHFFAATGETPQHKHKFAFNASLLRLVKRTLERFPSFCSFLLLFLLLLPLQACGKLSELDAAAIVVVPVVVYFQMTATAAA